MAQALRTSLQAGGLTQGGLRPGLGGDNIFASSALDLNFGMTKSLGGLVTFTRASSGTYVGSNGVLKTATTNFRTFSDAILTANSFGANLSTLTTVTTATPTASTTASLFTLNAGANTGNNTDGFNYGSSITLTNSTQHTQSLFVKPAGATVLRLRSNVSGSLFDFTLTGNGTAPSISNELQGAFIVSLANGWYRISWTFTTTTSAPGNRGDYWTIKTNVADGTNGLYVVGAQLEQSSTVGEYIPTTSTINSAPRFDHNPTTGESLGLLVEEQRTNSIRNNTMVGAVAGTPGTLPTNWASTLGGLAFNVVGTGTESGITYIDVQFVGTTSSTSCNLRFEGNAQIAASNGQAWTSSFYVRRVNGANTNISSITNTIYFRDASQTILASQNSDITASISAASIATNRTANTLTAANASTAFVNSAVALSFASGVAIDITLRIGLPQLEQGAFATSVIPTTGTTATRSADVASITGTNFSSWYRQDTGTFFADATLPYTVPGTQFPILASANDGTGNNTITLGYLTSNVIGFEVITTGVAQATMYPSISSAISSRRIAGSYALNDFAVAGNTTTVLTDTSGTIPTTSQLRIGDRAGAAVNYSNGTIRRLTYWPQRLSNQVLQTISGPALPASVVSDPYFSSVSMLLHMNGSNGSTTFTDNSSGARAITANGNAQISTAQSKFGGAAGLFDGSGDYLSFSEISIGALTDVTLECWVYLNSVSDVGIFGTTFSGNWQLLAVMAGKLFAYWNGVQVEEPTASITTSTWYHVAITRASGTLRLFVNGTLSATASSSTNNLTVSRVANTSFRGDLNGYIDDARITVGVARYTASFTAPTAAFPDN